MRVQERSAGRQVVGQEAQGRTTLTILQAAARCGVGRRTIYNWLQAGKIEYLRTAGGTVRIFEDSLWQPAAPSWETQRRGGSGADRLPPPMPPADQPDRQAAADAAQALAGEG